MPGEMVCNCQHSSVPFRKSRLAGQNYDKKTKQFCFFFFLLCLLTYKIAIFTVSKCGQTPWIIEVTWRIHCFLPKNIFYKAFSFYMQVKNTRGCEPDHAHISNILYLLNVFIYILQSVVR